MNNYFNQFVVITSILIITHDNHAFRGITLYQSENIRH